MLSDAQKESHDKVSSVMIAGGSGMIGRYLTSVLLENGYKVSHLSRGAGRFGRVRVFRWDPEKDIIDPSAFNGIDYLINLSGENIGAKRWTEKRKKSIMKSRILSTEYLYETVSRHDISLKAYITASATGYYGTSVSDRIFLEEDPPGKDFTGITCRLWEKAADLFKERGIRVVKIRSAVVLEKESGLLERMKRSSRFNVVTLPGNGLQYLPWIHITDLCNVFLKAVSDNTMAGPYNAVAPDHVTWNSFAERLIKAMKNPAVSVRVPSRIIKIILGEMSEIVLNGNRVSGDKLISSGFRYKFDNLADALEEISLSSIR